MIKYKKYIKALAIVEAYHKQILNDAESVKPKKEYKSKDGIEVGGFVECIEVHGNSITTLTKGEKYEVRRTRMSYNERDKYFSIKSNSGKLKEYNIKNTQFKLC